MSSDPRPLAHEVGIGTVLKSHATGGRLENTPFYLPLEADWRTLHSTYHWRKTGEHSVLPVINRKRDSSTCMYDLSSPRHCILAPLALH